MIDESVYVWQSTDRRMSPPLDLFFAIVSIGFSLLLALTELATELLIMSRSRGLLFMRGALYFGYNRSSYFDRGTYGFNSANFGWMVETRFFCFAFLFSKLNYCPSLESIDFCLRSIVVVEC